MFRRLFVSVFAVWAWLVSTILIVPAETIFPPGLRIGLEPPVDMKPSTRLPGFEDIERNAVIAILDLPASAYRDLENSAFALNQQGLDQLKRESFPFENGIGFLISGIAQQNGAKIYRWSLLAMGIGPSVPNLTMLVNVEVPESALSVYSDAVVRKALASVTFRPAPIQEQLGMLPFSLGDLSGFQVMQVMPTGTVFLADNPSNDNERKPFMIVSIDRGGPPEAADRAQFARNLLDSIIGANAGRWRARSRDPRKRQRPGRRSRSTGAMGALQPWRFFARDRRQPCREMGPGVRAFSNGPRWHHAALKSIVGPAPDCHWPTSALWLC
jgi:hypothetical protein